MQKTQIYGLIMKSGFLNILDVKVCKLAEL